VRQTLDDAGGVLATTNYDPWGTPQGTLSAPFGFTEELHSAGQVYLRARWYAPGQGRFVSEDPFAGFPEMPYSLHAYQYAYSNPVQWTDPSGEVIPWCPIGYKRITREDGSFGGCEQTGKVPQWVSDISLTLPGPLLVGPAPGVAGQLGGRTLPQLGTPTASELAQSCLGLTRLLLLSQSHVTLQTETHRQRTQQEIVVLIGVGYNFQEIALVAIKHPKAQIIIADPNAFNSPELKLWLRFSKDQSVPDNPVAYPKPAGLEEQFQNDPAHVYQHAQDVPSGYADYVYCFHPTTGNARMYAYEAGRILKTDGHAFFATAERNVYNDLVSQFYEDKLEMIFTSGGVDEETAARALGLTHYPFSWHTGGFGSERFVIHARK